MAQEEKKTLRRLRMEQEKKLVQVARAAKISTTALWYWEMGQRTPSVDNMEKLAGALGVTFDDVLQAVRVTREKYALAPAG